MKNNKIFGFWLYLMNDCIFFSGLFSTFIVLKTNNLNLLKYNIYNIYYILIETILLLLSSLTIGIATSYKKKKFIKFIISFLGITFILGSIFIFLELKEFYEILFIKNFFQNNNAFISAYLTLLSAHGIHVIFGLLWILIMIIQIFLKGLNKKIKIRLKCLNLFWHFLEIIWICLFTYIYLIGSL